MEVCRKYQITVTGCSKWNGENTRRICHLCLSEYILPLLKNTPIKTQYNTVKTPYNMVKTVSTLGKVR